MARNAAKQYRALPGSLPSPVGGWNTRDSLDDMPEQDAIVLDNWFPGLGKVSVRPGASQHATGMAGTVETLAEYNAGAVRKLLAAGGGSIYDASGVGAVGAALLSGMTSNRWQTANFSARQFWVNGSDAPRTFDGATFALSAWTGPADPTKLINVAVFKSRLLFAETNKQGFWYPAVVGAVTGALTYFDLSLVTETGGNLLAISTIGVSEAAPDDLAAFIMTTGEVLLYAGTDPGSAAAWALVGRYRIGAPVNRRAVVRFGGDTMITTQQDHTSLNTWFAAARNGITPPLSKISGAVIGAAGNSALFGWQSIVYPRGGKAIFNVPLAAGGFEQHVVNTVTGAWCRYAGLNASCWGLYNDVLYFGAASGVVWKAEAATSDNGVAIACDGQQAWSDMGSPRRKRVSLARPVIESQGAIPYSFGIGYDFEQIIVSASAGAGATGSPWDTSPWDTSPWSPETQITQQWGVQIGSGQSVGMRLKVSALQSVSWLRTDLRYEAGRGL